MSSNPAAVAPTLTNGAPMGSAQAKLSGTETDDEHARPAQCMDHHKSRSQSHLNQFDGNATMNNSSPSNAGTAGLSIAKSQHQAPLHNPNDHTQSFTERTINVGMHTPAAKRRKLTRDVCNYRPSLIVKLPLILGKENLSNESAHQSPFASIEENKIVVSEPSTRLVGSQLSSNTASPESEFCQQTVQMQAASEELRTVSRGEGNDTAGPLAAQSSRESSKLPQSRDKGKCRMLPSTEASGELPREGFDTVAQFRRDWPVCEKQISDEELLVALRSVSAEDVARRLMSQRHAQMKDHPAGATESESESTLTGKHTAKQHVVIDLCSSSEEEDGTPQDISNRVANASTAAPPEALNMFHGRHDQALTVVEATDQIARANSQQINAQNISQSPAVASVDVPGRKHMDNILRKVRMMLRVKRLDGAMLPVAYITLEQIHTSEDFFRAAEYEFQGILGAGEQFARALVLRSHGTWISDMQTGLTLERGSRRNVTWDMWLLNLRAVYKRDPIAFGLTLSADIMMSRINGQGT